MTEQRETAATEIVQRRARTLGAGTDAIEWGTLGARNAIRAGESCHRAVEVGVVRVTDVMEIGQPALRGVQCPEMVQHDGSDDCPVHRDATVIAYFKGGHTNIAGGGSPAGCIKWRNVTWYRIAEAAVAAVNGRNHERT